MYCLVTNRLNGGGGFLWCFCTYVFGRAAGEFGSIVENMLENAKIIIEIDVQIRFLYDKMIVYD